MIVAAPLRPKEKWWDVAVLEELLAALEKSTAMVEAIQSAKGKLVKLTVYEGVGHNSWSRAYEDQELWEWIVQQKR